MAVKPLVKTSVSSNGATGSNGGTFKAAADVFSNDTSLATFTVAGKAVANGSTVTVGVGTTRVNVVASPTDMYASAAISGNTGLRTGNNTVSVVVTADDGTVKTYTVTVIVPGLSSDKTLATFTIAGGAVSPGDTVHLPSGTSSVAVVALPTDNAAIVSIRGAAVLVGGNNTVKVTVTAEDGSTATYNVTVVVDSLSSDTSLTLFKILGTNVTNGSSLDAPPGTTRVSVSAVATDSGATVVVSGNDNLHAGANTVTVKVTAADGTIATNLVTVTVKSLSSVKTLATLTVNGTDTAGGSTVTALPGTTSVPVIAVATSAAATVAVSGNTALKSGNNTVTITVTAEDSSVATYTVTVNVLTLSAVKTLSSITVNGSSVMASSTVDLAAATTRATVIATPTDSKATVSVTGNTGLVGGANTVTITVTAENGTTATYTLTLNVLILSSVKTLSTFTVGGNTVANASVVSLPAGSKTVAVVATPTESKATVSISGNTGLSAGSNTLTAIVTAEDGTTATYTVTINVAAFSSNKNLSAFKVNGSTTTDASTIVLAPGTTAVEVIATPEDSASTVVITGKSGLKAGSNTLSVTVTAADGSTKTYSVTLSVTVLSSNTNLSVFTVNGSAAADNGKVTVAPGTTRVTVVATAADQDATVAVAGNTGIKTGDNYLTVTVTAADGTIKVRNFTITVTPANGTGLSTFTANGNTVVDGENVNLAAGTTSVSIVATPTDAALGATASVSGNTGLVGGVNNVTVTVTAGDGVTKQTYTIHVTVATLSTVKTLSTFTVNGSAVTDAGTFNLAAGTTSVSVVATPTDSNATVAIAGRAGLIGGNNTLSVTVTAVDGSTKTYSVTLKVAVLSSDKTLKTLTVNGNTTSANSTINLPATTSSVSVAATANDAGAVVSFSGATGLKVGSNTLGITVTAADSSSTTYTVTLVVAALSSDKSLSVFTMNGTTVADGGSINVAAGTTSVAVVATPTDSNSTVSIFGRTGLVGGANTVTVTVTAQDSSTKSYKVTVNVAVLSSVKTLSVFTVNGTATTSSSTINLPAGTASVTAVATPTDAKASAVITGRTGLVTGNNTLTVTVTAEDGSTATYTVTLKVLALSGDTSIKTITVNDTTTVAVGGIFYVDPGIATVDNIRVATNEPTAQVVITGASNLANGSNTVNIKVTAPNGTVANYSFTIVVSLLSSDATLKTLTINNQAIIVAGVRNITGKITLESNITDLTILATANDPSAKVFIDGDKGLIPGTDNFVSISLTAADGTPKIYNVTVHIKGDTSLSELLIGQDDLVPGNALFDGLLAGTKQYVVPFGTKNLAVTAVPTANDGTKVKVTVPSLVTGNNTVTVTVTPRDTSTAGKLYTFVVHVSNDTTLKSLLIGTTAVKDGDTFSAPYGTTSVTFTATTNDANSVVTYNGNANFVSGNNTVTVRVTGKDGSFTESVITVNVASPSADNSLSVLTINGKTAKDGDSLTLPMGSTSVTVVATATESHAVVAVTGATGLKAGKNTVTIKVTAQNGAIATKTITINVAANNDQWLLVGTAPTATVGVIVAKEDGVSVTPVDASTASQVVINGTGWSTTWTPNSLANVATNLDASKHLVVASGASTAFAASGFAANSEARVYLGTTLLGTFTASATGGLSGSVAIANTIAPDNYVLTITGFTPGNTSRWVSLGFTVKAGYKTTIITVTFAGTAAVLAAAAAKLLAPIPALIKGSPIVSIDIKGWAAGAKASAALTKLGTTRATAIKTALTKLKVTGTYTVGFGGLEKATSKTSRGVITITYAAP